VEEHAKVVQEVGGLLAQPLVRLLAPGARGLLGLLLDLRADSLRAGAEQLCAVAPLGPLCAALSERALERGQCLVRRHGLVLEGAVEARSLAGVAGGSRRLHERQQRVRVAVVAQRAQALHVARRLALVPQLAARAAPEVDLAACERAVERLAVHIGERQHLAGAPILGHARHEPALVERDLDAGDPRVGLH
jgi:hypothetical protein